MNKLDNYIIIDIGANLTNKKFARDLDAVIGRAKEAGESRLDRSEDFSLFPLLPAGVTKIIATGTTLQTSKDALRLARLNPGVIYSTAGKALQQKRIIS